MSARRYDYTVVEDNGGGLHLFLFEPGTDTLVSGFTDFEFVPGALAESLDGLDAGDDTSGWEGEMYDAQEEWNFLQSHEYGHWIIAYSEGDTRVIKPDRMGKAGQTEFCPSAVTH
jgi:hypothetical protein